MKKGIAKRAIVLSALVGMTVVAACGKSETKEPSGSKASPSPSAAAAKADPIGKYDPPIDVTAVKLVDAATKFADGETIENNVWTKAYEEKLGIKLKYNWVVTGKRDQYNQKLNVTMASNDLPEIMSVDATQLKQLVESDQLADLTGIFDQYATDLTKQIMKGDGGTALKAATFNGKLRALPNTGGDIDAVPLLWVRMDWLNSLNLPEPKTMQDVLKISEAFTTQDPDKNGKNDTFGIASLKDLWGGFAGLEGFFNSYHAYPNNMWLKDSSGKLVYGSIQPEMKAALAKLQELYKAGQLDKEFGVKDSNKVAESVTSGKVGLVFGQMWNPIFPFQDGKNKDPKMEWKSFPLPSIDGTAVKGQVPFGVSEYFVITKQSKHPEAIVKLMNLWNASNYGTDPKYFVGRDDKYKGIETFKYTVVRASGARENLDNHKLLKQVFQTKDTSKLNEGQLKGIYEPIMKFRAGDNSGWAMERVFGDSSSWEVIDGLLQRNQILMTAYLGAPTEGMVDKKATLDKLELETYTKIIYGNASPDEFDKFVENWKKLGGDQITTEVNKWFAAQK